MIVTFDTTILVRATKRSTGPARRVVELLAAHPEHQIGLSSYVLSEVGKVLSYPRLQRLYGLNSEDIHAHLAYLRSICFLVEPHIGIPVALLDPADDPIIYTAITAGADVLCARDRHFFQPNVQNLCKRLGIRVMDELDLLAEIEPNG